MFMVYLSIQSLFFYHVSCGFTGATWMRSDNYGPYKEVFSDVALCRGPKAVNLTSYRVKIYNVNETQWMCSDITFLEDGNIDELKMAVYLRNNTRKPFWSYKVPNLCQHFMIASLIETYVGRKNCLVKKGHYIIDKPMTGNLQTFIGPHFYYGDFVMKWQSSSKKGNIYCITYRSLITKKI